MGASNKDLNRSFEGKLLDIKERKSIGYTEGVFDRIPERDVVRKPEGYMDSALVGISVEIVEGELEGILVNDANGIIDRYFDKLNKGLTNRDKVS